MKKAISLFLAVCFLCLSLAACSPETETEHKKVKFEMKDGGTFVIELYPEYAPKTVANFLKLVESKFYDGLTFHRVYKDFMAQGGDPSQVGRTDTADTIVGEFRVNGFTQNTLQHDRGIVSMARTKDYDSASGQFFICYSRSSNVAGLDGEYAAFGKVIEGMEVVDAFIEVGLGFNPSMNEFSTPLKTIEIKSAVVLDS